MECWEADRRQRIAFDALLVKLQALKKQAKETPGGLAIDPKNVARTRAETLNDANDMPTMGPVSGSGAGPGADSGAGAVGSSGSAPQPMGSAADYTQPNSDYSIANQGVSAADYAQPNSDYSIANQGVSAADQSAYADPQDTQVNSGDYSVANSRDDGTGTLSPAGTLVILTANPLYRGKSVKEEEGSAGAGAGAGAGTGAGAGAGAGASTSAGAGANDADALDSAYVPLGNAYEQSVRKACYLSASNVLQDDGDTSDESGEIDMDAGAGAGANDADALDSVYVPLGNAYEQSVRKASQHTYLSASNVLQDDGDTSDESGEIDMDAYDSNVNARGTTAAGADALATQSTKARRRRSTKWELLASTTSEVLKAGAGAGASMLEARRQTQRITQPNTLFKVPSAVHRRMTPSYIDVPAFDALTTAPTMAPVTDAPTAAPTDAPVTDAPTAASSAAPGDVVYLRTMELHNGKSNGPEYILASGEGDSDGAGGAVHEIYNQVVPKSKRASADNLLHAVAEDKL